MSANYPCYLSGQPVREKSYIDVENPYDGTLAGRVSACSHEHTQEAIQKALSLKKRLTRHERFTILDQTRRDLESQKEDFSKLITSEAGLCRRETLYEVERACDVLQFSAMEALKDDGQIFSCDVSPQGKARKIFTLREPLNLAVAITPFNHPLNQVAHKLGPAIAAGTPLILKPSEKTPLTAIRFAELLYKNGLPGEMLSVLLGPTSQVAQALVQDERVELVSFTGSVAVGKSIARTAGYKKLVLELGGNDPLIILEDADLEHAVHLACEGSFRNSGQRCTAVKRILVQASILETFTEAFVKKAASYTCGDPASEDTMVGTVIDAPSAKALERVVVQAVSRGARILMGGKRNGALMEPTIIADVPRDAEMITSESFGPLAPILPVRDIEDAIDLANATPYGLSSGVVTRNMEHALRFVKELKCGNVNVNEVPGYRVECSPFGGINDSGLGIKEGVIEAIKCMSTVKTFSLPW
ncbi:MAG: aldehyde dehydrogenase family protein [Verrucomicrobiota bacterium]|nr:aldehyde dehydrogenase family protein [Verrucomicrobiota bacterium]